MGALLAEREALDEALEYGKKAVEGAERVDDPLILAEQLVLLALTYRDLNLTDKASSASQQAAELYQQLGEVDFAERALQIQREAEAKLQTN
jgi:hypothetical protein